MKTHYLFVVVALIFVAGLAVAGEKSKPVGISVGADATESDVPELSKIVVLCAKEEEEKFEKEWSNYVAQNDLKGAELQKTIKWVSDEAAIERKKNEHMHDDEGNDEAWKAERQKLMNEYARRAKML